MSMQFASALLVNRGDGIGVCDSSMDGDPAGSWCCSGQGAMGRSCWVAVCVCRTWCCSVRGCRGDLMFRGKIGYSACGWMVLVLVALGGLGGKKSDSWLYCGSALQSPSVESVEVYMSIAYLRIALAKMSREYAGLHQKEAPYGR